MQHNRHAQLRRLHLERKRAAVEEELAELERRQNGWDRFTDGVKSVFSDIKAPFVAPKTTETPLPTSIPAPPKRPPPPKDDDDDDDDDKPAKPAPKPSASTSSSKPTPTSTLNRATTTSAAQMRSSVGLPASVLPTETAEPLTQSSLAFATEKTLTPTPTLAPLETTNSISPAASSAAAARADAQRAEQEANSTAAKAGIAFGVIGGVLVLFMIVWFIIKKRKEQLERQKLDDERFNDEKFNREFASASASNAPAVPLAAGAIATDHRPRTANSANGEKQLPVFPKNTETAWERPTTGNSSHSSNPFGKNAETITRPVSPLSEIGIATSGAPVSPVAGPTTNYPAAAVAGGALGGAAAAGALTRKASLRKDLPRPPDLTISTPAPANSYNGPPSAGAPSPGGAAIAAAGGPPASAVHRVELDFVPTMEDELELKAGDLVRLLFEYDDGWALCIRLDRSKQGVVPRTCLSVRPVKPRPGPGRPQQQPMSRGPGSIERKPVPGQAY